MVHWISELWQLVCTGQCMPEKKHDSRELDARRETSPHDWSVGEIPLGKVRVPKWMTRMWLMQVIGLTLTGMFLSVAGNQLGLATEFRNDFTIHGHNKKVGLSLLLGALSTHSMQIGNPMSSHQLGLLSKKNWAGSDHSISMLKNLWDILMVRGGSFFPNYFQITDKRRPMLNACLFLLVKASHAASFNVTWGSGKKSPISSAGNPLVSP